MKTNDRRATPADGRNHPAVEEPQLAIAGASKKRKAPAASSHGVSLVVSICNPPELTANFLRSIRELRAREDFETIIVVDGDHDTRTHRLLREAKKEVQGLTAVFRDRIGGYSVANNQAVAHATGEVLAFINSDTFLAPGALTKLASYVRTQPDVGVAQGLLLYPQSLRVQSTGHVFGPYFNRHALAGRPASLPIIRRPCDRQALTSAFYAVRRRVFEDHGGFDEFYWNSHEAMEFALRVHLSGLRCAYRPDAVAYHIQGSSRRHLPLEERQHAARFWSTWGRHAKRDLDQLLLDQLQPQHQKRNHLLINASTNRGWLETLRTLPLKFTEVAAIRPFGQALILHDTLVPELHRSKSPLLFLTDQFAHITSNLLWLRERPCHDDLILDCHGNVVTMAEVLG